MKNILLVAFSFFVVFQLKAQEKNQIDDARIYRLVDEKAEPKEGLSTFLSVFANEFNSLIVPPKSDEISFKVKFVVEKNGALSNIEISENEDASAYYEEIVRVLKTMPAWKPAEHNGAIVRTIYTLPIKLRFPMRNVDTALLDKAILERTISNQYFEFECNCKLINESTNRYNKVKDFSYNTLDNNVFYSFALNEIVLNNEEHYFNVIKANAVKQNATIKEIDYKSSKALESNFVIYSKDTAYYNNILYFVVGKYLISINVISTNEQISKYSFTDLKKTFKLKN